VTSRRLAACALAFALCGAGCGAHAGINRQASAQLESAVAGIRAAARAHDVVAARTRLDVVRRMVVSLRSRGDLSDVAAGRILLAADAVGADLGLIPTTTSTATTTLAPAQSTPPPPGNKKDHHGRGNGDNGDNGD
jgi:hypothetical protein